MSSLGSGIKKFLLGANININGKSIVGRSVVVVNGRVIVDGNDQNISDKVINISIEGDINNVTADVCEKVTITGGAGSVNTMSGDVVCGDVSSNVKTMSGDVKCGNVGGKIKTMSGDVKHRKQIV